LCLPTVRDSACAPSMPSVDSRSGLAEASKLAASAKRALLSVQSRTAIDRLRSWPNRPKVDAASGLAPGRPASLRLAAIAFGHERTISEANAAAEQRSNALPSALSDSNAPVCLSD